MAKPKHTGYLATSAHSETPNGNVVQARQLALDTVRELLPDVMRQLVPLWRAHIEAPMKAKERARLINEWIMEIGFMDLGDPEQPAAWVADHIEETFRGWSKHERQLQDAHRWTKERALGAEPQTIPLSSMAGPRDHPLAVTPVFCTIPPPLEEYAPPPSEPSDGYIVGVLSRTGPHADPPEWCGDSHNLYLNLSLRTLWGSSDSILVTIPRWNPAGGVPWETHLNKNLAYMREVMCKDRDDREAEARKGAVPAAPERSAHARWLVLRTARQFMRMSYKAIAEQHERKRKRERETGKRVSADTVRKAVKRFAEIIEVSLPSYRDASPSQ
jgi:hypothetical protein